MVSRLAADIATLQTRKSRLEARAERKREVALGVMVEAGDDFARIEEHDFTASVKATARQLLVSDESVLPAEYFEQPPLKLRRAALKAALKAGADVLGASLTNSAPTLQIFVK